MSHTPQVLSIAAGRPPAGLLGRRGLDRRAGAARHDTDRRLRPGLWAEILTANAVPLAEVLAALRRDLDTLVHALGSAELGDEETLAEALRRGNAGHARVPGKHGAAATPTAVVPVAVPDEPGQLGRLFAAVAEAGCSVEDVRIEHVLGRPTGVVEISVAVAAVGPLSSGAARAGLGRPRLRRRRPGDWRRNSSARPPQVLAARVGAVDTSLAIVAIDGPSGSGKSSTSRGVARALGLEYLDTGAMYRAMAWFMLERGVDVQDPAAVAALAARADADLHDRRRTRRRSPWTGRTSARRSGARP